MLIRSLEMFSKVFGPHHIPSALRVQVILLFYAMHIIMHLHINT